MPKYGPKLGNSSQDRAVKGLTIQSAADRKAQPGVTFELSRRKIGKVTAGMLNDLRQEAEKGNKSAIKAYEAYTQSPGLFSKRGNGRRRGPLRG